MPRKAFGPASPEAVADDNTSPELAERTVRRRLVARVAVISLASSGKLLADGKPFQVRIFGIRIRFPPGTP
jgi:hypothetical protein